MINLTLVGTIVAPAPNNDGHAHERKIVVKLDKVVLPAIGDAFDRSAHGFSPVRIAVVCAGARLFQAAMASLRNENVWND